VNRSSHRQRKSRSAVLTVATPVSISTNEDVSAASLADLDIRCINGVAIRVRIIIGGIIAKTSRLASSCNKTSAPNRQKIRASNQVATACELKNWIFWFSELALGCHQLGVTQKNLRGNIRVWLINPLMVRLNRLEK